MGPVPKSTRKRSRKRKRRVVSDTSSSEEDTSSSSSSVVSIRSKTVTIPIWQANPLKDTKTDEDNASFSSDDDDTDSGEEDADISVPSTSLRSTRPPQRDSPSPPPNMDIPPFVTQNAPENEQALKEKFRKFWMTSIAEGFKEDLEEIRKEPNLGASRLALLIESLASGADVFSSSSAGVKEMEVVLDQLP